MAAQRANIASLPDLVMMGQGKLIPITAVNKRILIENTPGL
jgi:hypothetical protein